ncbi:hypothetical protein TraAM80_08604 [Trypanosoma rangeli]|uniref:Uncharacterized protein n=1 Tax=Trypanosoma rangeli TaxID=5698 RepID=A0A422MZZ9_TRYRA|nr:uncharacterized protein TraAM80_08604 [Trypanosoma rangeli]RNE98757.1 hypothetical protein TraAM80_08604 [Trypanosoma rangeli]|eukprot:RNE98757.1 hypothetical protein TraAM80_08604 [Trypanosoma rangeli]
MRSRKLQANDNVSREDASRPINELARFGILVAGACGCLCVCLFRADMATVGTVAIVFVYFGIPYAFVYDYFGVRPLFVLGLVLITVGALLMALTFSGAISTTVLRPCDSNSIANFGVGVYGLAGVVTVASLFPTRRGVIVAVMEMFAGLGFAILGSIQLAYLEGQPTN